MAEKKRKYGMLLQILTAVIVALVAGGTAPWWWKTLTEGDSTDRIEDQGGTTGGQDTLRTEPGDSGTLGGIPDTTQDIPLVGEKQPNPDFDGGSTPVYNAVFNSSLTWHTENGSVTLEWGCLVIHPVTNSLFGPQHPMDIKPELVSDFVLDIRFRMEGGQMCLHAWLSGSGPVANYIEAFLDVSESRNVYYTLQTGKVRKTRWVMEESIAHRVLLPTPHKDHDWSRSGKITFKRQGGLVQFFVNNIFVVQFPMPVYPVSQIDVGAAGSPAGTPTAVVISSIEARLP